MGEGLGSTLDITRGMGSTNVQTYTKKSSLYDKQRVHYCMCHDRQWVLCLYSGTLYFLIMVPLHGTHAWVLLVINAAPQAFIFIRYLHKN